MADIVRQFREELAFTSPEQRRVLDALAACRTARLGGHRLACDSCDEQVLLFNSCRDRHCPKCGGLAELRWIQAREQDLLPVHYFHTVFTVPHALHAFFRADRRLAFNLLFAAATESLQQLALNPRHLGARIACLAVLHTWSKTLAFHPHIHCIVPGGGIAPGESAWLSSKKKFFLPVKALSELFRGKLLSAFQRAIQSGRLKLDPALDPARLLRQAARPNWVVYCKESFDGPTHVIRYLGRYTHRIAISNERLLALRNGEVTFRYKDRKDHDRQKTMTLPGAEFLTRFLDHVLPAGFVRIRAYGFLANGVRREKLALARKLLGAEEPGPRPEPETAQQLLERVTGKDITRCPHCRRGTLRVIERLPRDLNTPPAQKWAIPGRATSP